MSECEKAIKTEAEEMLVDKPVPDSEQSETKSEAETENNGREFSSENFKIELQNLPKFFGFGQIKKLINKKLNLNANKIKPCGKNYMFVCFRNEEDKEKALMVLNGFEFKGKKMIAISAKAAADPYKQKKARETVVDTRPNEERIQGAVCPLAKLSYENQLAKKMEEIVTVVKMIGSEISKMNPSLKPLVQRRLLEHGTVAPIQEFIQSPLTRGYRNKCEFSVGYSSKRSKAENGSDQNIPDVEKDEVEKSDKMETDTALQTISVGFRLATYKQGCIEVVSLSSLEQPEDVLPHISPNMIKAGILFEKFVEASGILPYSSLGNTGNWRHIMLRCSGTEQEQLMVVVVLEPKGLLSSQLEQVRKDLLVFFMEGAAKPCGVTSLFLQLAPAKKTQGVSDPVPELLAGDPVITEQLFNLKFSISPQAFFQVNSKGAEALYKSVGDLADLQENSTLVDVCCGTGTIGLCLADRVKKVLGVELVPEAVRDARKNAENNGVTNCSFFAGRAEDILYSILRDIDSNDIVAVVDPPRAGLHHKALGAIRNNLAIKRLVFVSCDAKAATKNFVDLSRPASKTAKGNPFFPVKIVPVDLFPHTKQFELVLLFQRLEDEDLEVGVDPAANPDHAEPIHGNSPGQADQTTHNDASG